MFMQAPLNLTKEIAREKVNELSSWTGKQEEQDYHRVLHPGSGR